MGIHVGPMVGRSRCSRASSARAHRRGLRDGDRAVGRRRLHGLVPERERRAYERPQREVTGNPSDNYEAATPVTGGMREGVRYQIYEPSDGHILFMASEQAFWKNFCDGDGAARPLRQVAGLEVSRIMPVAISSCGQSCATSSRPRPRRNGSSSAANTTPHWHRSTRPRASPTTSSFRTASRGSPRRRASAPTRCRCR